MVSIDTIKATYPLHYCVWNNDIDKLNEFLETKEYNTESLDCRGRTPLMLAVVLGHLECARVLVRHGGSTLAENTQCWSVSQEAICTGDPEMVQLILMHREKDAVRAQGRAVPQLLEKLNETPDFYVEMRWEFTSWIPLVSRMCPSDTNKVWKSGSNVRIDTTLLGFNSSNSWMRGNQSYVFRVTNTGAIIDEIDHANRVVYRQEVRTQVDIDAARLMPPSQDFVAQKLTRPLFTTFLDTERILFERSKSGVWGWRSDKTETINNHVCKVYSASNVQVVTKKRTEHLTDAEKAEFRRLEKEARGRNPLQSFLTVAEKEEKSHNPQGSLVETESFYNPCQISAEEYFDHRTQLGGTSKRDIGRPQEITTKTQTFKAHLSLCDDYPLSLQEQVMPIIDLMSESNPHFKKLKDFVTLQLPVGFPMKVEIPLYHVMTARITFENLFGADTPAEGVTCLRSPQPEEKIEAGGAYAEYFSEDGGNDGETVVTSDGALRNVDGICCFVDESIFEIPQGYTIRSVDVSGSSFGRGGNVDEEEQMLQMAIQQSIEDSPANVSLPPAYFNEEEAMLQQAIAASLATTHQQENTSTEAAVGTNGDSQNSSSQSDFVMVGNIQRPEYEVGENVIVDDDEFQKALEISKREQEEMERARLQEDEELARILELSKLEQ